MILARAQAQEPVLSRNSSVPQSALKAVSRALDTYRGAFFILDPSRQRGVHEGREYHERGSTSITGAR